MGLGNQLALPWWRSKYVLWIAMMLPGLMFCIGMLRGSMHYDNLMHATGEFSARFLVFSLIATPLVMLFPGRKLPLWLNRNKRYFGVAAFIYGCYHSFAYIIEVPIDRVAKSFFDISLLTGWIAILIWMPMVITSTNGWVKRLKATWKKIHNWGYLAAVLALVHWALIHYHWKPALVHAAPIVLLQGYRWIKTLKNVPKQPNR